MRELVRRRHQPDRLLTPTWTAREGGIGGHRGGGLGAARTWRRCGAARPAGTSSWGSCPPDAAEKVAAAVFAAGAGRIGDYEGCAFAAEGKGWFTPGPEAHPAVGQAEHPRAHSGGALGDGGAARTGWRRSSTRTWRPIPTRSRRSTSIRWRTCSPAPDWGGAARCRAGDHGGRTWRSGWRRSVRADELHVDRRRRRGRAAGGRVPGQRPQPDDGRGRVTTC